MTESSRFALEKKETLEKYRLFSAADLMTPALAVYEAYVDANIASTLRLLNNQPHRWRPHVKTAKLRDTMSRLVGHGIKSLKCATTLELLVAIDSGAKDILVAYPCIGSRARRVLDIQAMNPSIRISALVDDASQVPLWRAASVELFIDIDPGMNRTGIDQDNVGEVVKIAKRIEKQGSRFAGLHYYEGHHRHPDLKERQEATFGGYRQLLRIVEELGRAGVSVDEVITSGTPALPCALAFQDFERSEFRHTLSPGTVVYNDTTSLSQLPGDWAYQPAALVISSVISQPTPDIVTCDAGHKTVSADSGFPNCFVLGHPELEPLHASEEHLPLRVVNGARPPKLGEILYLVPRHVCPTVNNFDHALLVHNGKIKAISPVNARGREVAFRGCI